MVSVQIVLASNMWSAKCLFKTPALSHSRFDLYYLIELFVNLFFWWRHHQHCGVKQMIDRSSSLQTFWQLADHWKKEDKIKKSWNRLRMIKKRKPKETCPQRFHTIVDKFGQIIMLFQKDQIKHQTLALKQAKNI